LWVRRRIAWPGFAAVFPQASRRDRRRGAEDFFLAFATTARFGRRLIGEHAAGAQSSFLVEE